MSKTSKNERKVVSWMQLPENKDRVAAIARKARAGLRRKMAAARRDGEANEMAPRKARKAKYTSQKWQRLVQFARVGAQHRRAELADELSAIDAFLASRS